ncbi:MAG: DUF3786 domain-containing protein [Treponema sp.]|nr:DUF3786 domain-containing protein [Treponema sp.]MCL2252699.1 DUF3786 domain-containing protein [Treponema sp.]
MGYDDAITLAMQKLDRIPPHTVCLNCGVHYENGEFYITWFNKKIALSDASVTQKILWLHYMTSNGLKNETGQLIAYREAAPALFYEPNFYKRAVQPLVNFFGKQPEKLTETGIALGGQKTEMGDASVKINVLPYLPLTFIIWQGCTSDEAGEEFAPDGNILFDKNAKTWLAAEDLAVIASAAVHELINFKK